MSIKLENCSSNTNTIFHEADYSPLKPNGTSSMFCSFLHRDASVANLDGKTCCTEGRCPLHASHFNRSLFEINHNSVTRTVTLRFGENTINHSPRQAVIALGILNAFASILLPPHKH
jgi:hypothetical protein